MSALLLRRFGQALLLLVIVSMIGFAILHLAPGGPMSQFAADGEMNQEDFDRVAELLGAAGSEPRASGPVRRMALADARW